MIFVTIEFVLFFLLFISCYIYLNKENHKLIWIAIFNCVFYAYYSMYALLYLLIWSILLYLYPYLKIYKKIYIVLGFAFIQILFWKLLESKIINIGVDWRIPLGFSFFTFQGLTYLFKVENIPYFLKNYKGEVKEIYGNEKWSLLKVFSFVGFFPTILSGPIERANRFEIQIKKSNNLNAEELSKLFNNGMWLILLGFFYKIVLANYLSQISLQTFSNPIEENIQMLWIGMYVYSLQIFYDFSGYSLMSMGILKLMNYDIDYNFKYPYLAENIKEFWSKWHISLSSWFRDYVYFYLGGNNKNMILNIFLVMLLSGLWHGILGQFIIWGFLHASAMAIYIYLNKITKINEEKISILKKYFNIFITFNFVSFLWIFFNSKDINTAFIYVKGMFFNESGVIYLTNIQWLVLLISFIFIKIDKFFIINLNNISKKIYYKNLLFIKFIFLFCIILLISPSGMPPFIYFQF